MLPKQRRPLVHLGLSSSGDFDDEYHSHFDADADADADAVAVAAAVADADANSPKYLNSVHFYLNSNFADLTISCD